MTREEVFHGLNEIFRDEFDDESIELKDTTTSEDIDGWDSLEQINLIVAVEEKFGMKFKMNEVTDMKNVGEMVNIILERTAK